MARRLELQAILEGILGSQYVYFQPPGTISMNYPCIVYEKNTIDPTFADDMVYLQRGKYSLIVIDRDPDTLIPDEVAKLPMCRAGQFYTFDNLYNYPFTLYY